MDRALVRNQSCFICCRRKAKIFSAQQFRWAIRLHGGTRRLMKLWTSQRYWLRKRTAPIKDLSAWGEFYGSLTKQAVDPHAINLFSYVLDLFNHLWGFRGKSIHKKEKKHEKLFSRIRKESSCPINNITKGGCCNWCLGVRNRKEILNVYSQDTRDYHLSQSMSTSYAAFTKYIAFLAERNQLSLLCVFSSWKLCIFDKSLLFLYCDELCENSCYAIKHYFYSKKFGLFA